MPYVSADNSAIVTVYDDKNQPHTIRITYMEQPPPTGWVPALKFNDPGNSMYLGGP
jgi:hypothetical protein